MTFNTFDIAKSILNEVRASAPATFSGLGLIFYSPPLRLPVIPLGDESRFLPPLPIVGSDRIAQILARISVADSPWHDGFHLIDVPSVEMTHVSQFFSPPLGASRHPVPNAPIGARHMAAMLGSTLPTVDITALLTKRGDLLVFKNGAPLPG